MMMYEHHTRFSHSIKARLEMLTKIERLVKN